jgi:protein tyrosine/serine phosphatase
MEIDLIVKGKSTKRTLIALSFIALVGYLYYASVVRVSKNFYIVDPGKFYRSAQLTPSELEGAIDKYGIKTVISLRGAPQNSYWYPGEVEVLEKRQVKFLHFGWTSDYFPHNDDFQGFMRALKEEQYPILVHCRTGADRTGEASAIYAIEYMHLPKDQAISEQLNFKYWHVPSFHPAKVEFVKRYQGFDWAMNQYNMCAPENKMWAEPGQCP